MWAKHSQARRQTTEKTNKRPKTNICSFRAFIDKSTECFSIEFNSVPLVTQMLSLYGFIIIDNLVFKRVFTTPLSNVISDYMLIRLISTVTNQISLNLFIYLCIKNWKVLLGILKCTIFCALGFCSRKFYNICNCSHLMYSFWRSYFSSKKRSRFRSSYHTFWRV